MLTLTEEATDTPTRQNALGALQKFSLRRGPQDVMIASGTVEWALRLLRAHLKTTEGGGHTRRPDTLSEYSGTLNTATLRCCVCLSTRSRA